MLSDSMQKGLSQFS